MVSYSNHEPSLHTRIRRAAADSNVRVALRRGRPAVSRCCPSCNSYMRIRIAIWPWLLYVRAVHNQRLSASIAESGMSLRGD